MTLCQTVGALYNPLYKAIELLINSDLNLYVLIL